MRMKMFLGAALIVALGAFNFPAEAQRQAVGGTADAAQPPRQLTRGALWHAFFNTGAEGARVIDANYTGLYADLDYPGLAIISWGGGTVEDFTAYHGSQTYDSSNQIDYTTHNGRGHGWWIAAKVDGKPVVSYGNALIKGKEESDDVFMMAADPTKDLNGRFAKVGNNVLSPYSGQSTANWWPGTNRPLDASEPREILNYRIGQYNDPAADNHPEAVVLSKWTTKLGITGTKAAFAWNHPEYDDFIIEEWAYENTGDTNGDGKPDLLGGGHNLKNVYFAFQHRLMTTSAGTSRGRIQSYYWDWGPLDACSNAGDNGQDDKIKYTEAPNYDGPASAKGLKMTYTYDWDNYCYTGQYADDVGDPLRSGFRPGGIAVPFYTKDGDLLSPAWIGVAEIDVDATDGFVGDNDKYEVPKVAQQPFAHNLFHFQHRQADIQVRINLQGDEPNPYTMNDDTMYQMIARSPDPSYFNSPRDRRPTRGSGDPNKGVPLLPLPDNPTGPMPYTPNPDWEWKGRHGIAAAYTVMDTYGPYDLAPGQKVKFAFAYVAGAPVEDSFKAFTRKQDNSELRKEENGLAFQNLVKHLRKAREAYALGYDLPNQPPDVDVKLTSSENAQVRLTWTDVMDKSVNPDRGQADVAGYRVYRSDAFPGQWELVGDVKVGDARYYNAASKTYSLEDLKSLAGFRYFYRVRAYQGSGNAAFKSRVTGKTVEGGVSAYESGTGDPSTFYLSPTGMLPFSPVQVASASADRLEKDLLIVPNPYIDDGMHAYTGTPKIRIMNVPRKCKIRVYNVSGDLVGEVDHDSATRGEAAYFQLNRTATTPLIFGTYFVTVESLAPESMGKVKRAIFVVIR